MMGSFLTRGLILIFGYAYPAYECFKAVEKNKPEIEQLLFWCQYWILVALLTVVERVGDTFVSWVPMYSEAKLAFFIYLWYPKTKGTTYVYDSFFRPYVAKHEPEIDRNLLELKTRAGDTAILYWQKAATYGQTRVFEILQYVASQSTSRPQGVETRCSSSTVRIRQEDATLQKPPQQLPQVPQPPSSRTSSTAPTQASPSLTSSMNTTQHQQSPSRTSSAGASPQQQEITLEKVSPSPASASAVQTEATAAPKPVTQVTSKATQIDAEVMQIEESRSSLSKGNTNPPPQEMVMDDIIRVTRGRLRKNRAGSKG